MSTKAKQDARRVGPSSSPPPTELVPIESGPVFYQRMATELTANPTKDPGARLLELEIERLATILEKKPRKQDLETLHCSQRDICIPTLLYDAVIEARRRNCELPNLKQILPAPLLAQVKKLFGDKTIINQETFVSFCRANRETFFMDAANCLRAIGLIQAARPLDNLSLPQSREKNIRSFAHEEMKNLPLLTKQFISRIGRLPGTYSDLISLRGQLDPPRQRYGQAPTNLVKLQKLVTDAPEGTQVYKAWAAIFSQVTEQDYRTDSEFCGLSEMEWTSLAKATRDFLTYEAQSKSTAAPDTSHSHHKSIVVFAALALLRVSGQKNADG